MNLVSNFTAAINAYLLTPLENLWEFNYFQFWRNCFDFSRAIIELIFDNLSSPITFTDLQIFLLKTFLIVIVINLALIGYYWNKYDSVITDRFIRPSTLKEIEELKSSVAKLKLPCEHTPRI